METIKQDESEKGLSLIPKEQNPVFYIVALKFRQLTYYLVDPKMSISLDKGSAMLFIDEDLARDYATKVELTYAEFTEEKGVGYTEKYNHLFDIQ